MVMTRYVKDMYNFNPGVADIATGIPNSANRIFEITGLAKEYRTVSQISCTVKRTGKPSAVKFVTPTNSAGAPTCGQLSRSQWL
jgi:hypothetical protein